MPIYSYTSFNSDFVSAVILPSLIKTPAFNTVVVHVLSADDGNSRGRKPGYEIEIVDFNTDERR